MEIPTTIILALIAMYEILSRVIPSSKTWSILGNVLNVLKLISEYLDRKK